MKTTLIYCAGGNRQWAEIAIGCGFAYGAQLPDTCYFPPIFADQDYKRPVREKYVSAVAKFHPRLATVIDWQEYGQLPEVLAWAEDIAPHVEEAIIIIPKVDNGIAALPRKIGGKDIWLGYSVPTKYGHTDTMLLEFIGWPVHLLGGSPKRQLHLARWLDVRSTDQNYIHHKIKFGQFFDGKRWLQLRENGYDVSGREIPKAVLELSLPAIRGAWANLG